MPSPIKELAFEAKSQELSKYHPEHVLSLLYRKNRDKLDQYEGVIVRVGAGHFVGFLRSRPYNDGPLFQTPDPGSRLHTRIYKDFHKSLPENTQLTIAWKECHLPSDQSDNSTVLFQHGCRGSSCGRYHRCGTVREFKRRLDLVYPSVESMFAFPNKTVMKDLFAPSDWMPMDVHLMDKHPVGHWLPAIRVEFLEVDAGTGDLVVLPVRWRYGALDFRTYCDYQLSLAEVEKEFEHHWEGMAGNTSTTSGTFSDLDARDMFSPRADSSLIESSKSPLKTSTSPLMTSTSPLPPSTSPLISTSSTCAIRDDVHNKLLLHFPSHENWRFDESKHRMEYRCTIIQSAIKEHSARLSGQTHFFYGERLDHYVFQYRSKQWEKPGRHWNWEKQGLDLVDGLSGFPYWLCCEPGLEMDLPAHAHKSARGTVPSEECGDIRVHESYSGWRVVHRSVGHVHNCQNRCRRFWYWWCLKQGTEDPGPPCLICKLICYPPRDKCSKCRRSAHLCCMFNLDGSHCCPDCVIASLTARYMEINDQLRDLATILITTPMLIMPITTPMSIPITTPMSTTTSMPITTSSTPVHTEDTVITMTSKLTALNVAYHRTVMGKCTKLDRLVQETTCLYHRYADPYGSVTTSIYPEDCMTCM